MSALEREVAPADTATADAARACIWPSGCAALLEWMCKHEWICKNKQKARLTHDKDIIVSSGTATADRASIPEATGAADMASISCVHYGCQALVVNAAADNVSCQQHSDRSLARRLNRLAWTSIQPRMVSQCHDVVR